MVMEQDYVVTAKPSQFESLNKITPTSKYLALLLFIVLPFFGGWIGYQYGLQNSQVFDQDVEKSLIKTPSPQEDIIHIDRPAVNSEVQNETAEYVLVCIGMSNANQECDDWLEKINGPLQNVINPNLTVINCAVGSHAIERWNDDIYNELLWNACIQKVLDAGLEVGDVKYVWHKAMVQYVRDEQNNLLPPYPAPASAYYKLIDEFDVFATRLPQFLPAVETVFMSGRSYGGFSTKPDRGEPLAKLSNQAIDEWLQDNTTVMDISYVHGPYLWALDCADQTGVEGCYVRTDYQQDGIHPAQGALNKITRLVHDYFSQYDWYVR